MTPEGREFFERLNRSTPKAGTKEATDALAVDMAERMERAEKLREADPHLDFISAITIAGDQMSGDRARRWVTEGLPGIDAMTFVGSYARLDFAIWAVENGHLERDVLLDELPELWSGSDPDDTDPRFLALWVEAWERNGGKTVCDGKALPRRQRLRVYRGQDEDAPLGIAWTLDPKVAEKFARGAGTRQANREGVVIWTDVRRDRPLAYLTGRSESEIILPAIGARKELTVTEKPA